jgi:dynactin complex subunit
VNGESWKVGECCFVNGSKRGLVAFVGETQFKEGVWAGVILETSEGKNNGSLNGVTYFRTEENRGIFCRLNKLTREPEEPSSDLNQSIVNEACANTADNTNTENK